MSPLDATAMAEAVRSRAASAEDLVSAALERIEARDG
jgi:Asp-tRNA(Asn)/Glu-tRNA(Gln) amidotransferase A subunit family amidase